MPLGSKNYQKVQQKFNLEDSEQRMGDNEEVNKVYFKTLTKVIAARESINRFAGLYNNEYAFRSNNKDSESHDQQP